MGGTGRAAGLTPVSDSAVQAWSRLASNTSQGLHGSLLRNIKVLWAVLKFEVALR